MLNDDKAVAVTLANETGAGNFSAPPWTSLFVASPKLTYNKLNLYPVIAFTGNDDRSYLGWLFPCDLEAILNLQLLLYALWKKPVESKHRLPMQSIYNNNAEYYILNQTTRPNTCIVVVANDKVQ